eukprot:TRINITY_DN5011_c0_g1_i1.p1 TRINITY_DN5011_c0_g1~~TRINITY_DN5011_c0_g1_i1.p1  ORF type:complete len:769 (+),score=175.78 TRINITY_DN5011_c0_g1_i1:65-2371(+)
MATSRAQRDVPWLKTPAVDYGQGPGSYDLAKGLGEARNAGAAPFGSSGHRDVMKGFRKDWVTPGPDFYQGMHEAPSPPPRAAFIGGGGERLHIDTVLRKNFIPGPGAYDTATSGLSPQSGGEATPQRAGRVPSKGTSVQWTKVASPPSIPPPLTHGYDERDGQLVRVPRHQEERLLHPEKAAPPAWVQPPGQRKRRAKGVPFSSGGDQHTAFTVDKDTYMVPGPGMYEVGKDMKKIDVKLCGVPYSQEAMVFRSGVQREPFAGTTLGPGPGAYSLPSQFKPDAAPGLGAAGLAATDGTTSPRGGLSGGPSATGITPSAPRHEKTEAKAPRRPQASLPKKKAKPAKPAAARQPQAAAAGPPADVHDHGTSEGDTSRKLLNSQQKTLRQILGLGEGTLTERPVLPCGEEPPELEETIASTNAPTRVPAMSAASTTVATTTWRSETQVSAMQATQTAAMPPSAAHTLQSRGALTASPTMSVVSRGVAPTFPPQATADRKHPMPEAYVPPVLARAAPAPPAPPAPTSGFASTTSRFREVEPTPGPGHYIEEGGRAEARRSRKPADVGAFGSTTARFPVRRVRLEIAAPHEQQDPEVDRAHVASAKQDMPIPSYTLTVPRVRAPVRDMNVYHHPEGSPIPPKPYKPFHQLQKPLIVKKKSEREIGVDFEKSVARRSKAAQAAAKPQLPSPSADPATATGTTFGKQARFQEAQAEQRRVMFDPSPQDYAPVAPAPPGFARISGARFPKIASTGPTATTYNTAQPFLKKTYNITM